MSRVWPGSLGMTLEPKVPCLGKGMVLEPEVAVRAQAWSLRVKFPSWQADACAKKDENRSCRQYLHAAAESNLYAAA